MIHYLTLQEAIHHFTNFLLWTRVIDEVAKDEGAGGAEEEEQENTSIALLVEENKSEEMVTIQTNSRLTWCIPKKPSYPHTAVTCLVEYFGAVNIIPALIKYLEKNVPSCRITLNEYGQFDVYKQIKADLPLLQGLSDKTQQDLICTSPQNLVKGQKPAEPVHFDCALVHNSPEAEDVGLKGR